jgi:polygalacturonase
VVGSILLATGAVRAADKIYNLKDFGGQGDGTTMNSEAFAKAMAACAATGGQVDVPAGTYLTGPIELKSGVDLHVEKGATILFSRNKDDFPLVMGSYSGQPRYMCQSPIWSDGAHDIAITGEGVVDGNGDAWRPLKRNKVTQEYWDKVVASGGVVTGAGNNATWYPSEAWVKLGVGLDRAQDQKGTDLEVMKQHRDLLRPCMVELRNSKGIRLEGVTFRNSPNWNLHPLLSDDITVKGVTVFNPAYAQNGDGIDVDSCRNVTIEDSKFDVGDDAICIKCGKDAPGRKQGRPTEHVTVKNCWIGNGHGGITIGSEMSGGVKDLKVSGITLDGTDAGLRFKSTRGRGGVVEDIDIRDVTMKNIRQNAIEFNMYYGVKGEMKTAAVDEGTPVFRNFVISGVKCESAANAFMIKGLPEMPIENISISDSDITAKAAGEISYGKGITLKNVKVNAPGEVKMTAVEGLVRE